MAEPRPSSRRRTPPSPRGHRPLPRGPQVRKGRRRLAVLLAPVLLAVLAVIGLRVAYADRALPGTQLGGTDVEGESRDALGDRMTRLATAPVTIVAAGRRLRVTPSAAGYVLDVDASLQRVLRAGRDGPLAGFVHTAQGLWTTRDVAPVARVDRGRLAATARAVARLADRAAFPGAVTVDPGTLRVTVQRPRDGRTVDVPALERTLTAALRAGRSQVLAPVHTTAVASLADVRRVADDARRSVAGPLVLAVAGAPPQSVPPERVAPLLRLRASAHDRTQVRLGSDEAAVAKLVAQVAARRDRPARSARVTAPARSVIVAGKGRLSYRPRHAAVRVTRKARVGRLVRRDRARVVVATAIREGRHRVTLPVVTVQPKLTAQAARRITSLIGTFTTHYEPGQPRVTNIRRIARTVDGTTIPPGGRFSLNGLVGPRTLAGGYVEAPFIADGKIVPSVGGGVSQFSTTMYNAAYFAGLRIDTHQPHSLYISRYPPGREATVNYPDIDLRWTNDTAAPVYVRTFTDATSLTVSLFGDNGGRKVTAVPGPRTPVPGKDFRITVVRTIAAPGGRTRSDSFTSTYDRGVG